MLDFWPLQLWDNEFLLLKPSSLWHFVTQPQKTNTLLIPYFMDKKTEAQGGIMTCPRSHGQLILNQDKNLVLAGSRTKWIVLKRVINKKEVASDPKTLATVSSKDLLAKIPRHTHTKAVAKLSRCAWVWSHTYGSKSLLSLKKRGSTASLLCIWVPETCQWTSTWDA